MLLFTDLQSKSGVLLTFKFDATSRYEFFFFFPPSSLAIFNIHICCPDKPLGKDFLSLIDSFDFTQAVCGALQLGALLGPDFISWY